MKQVLLLTDYSENSKNAIFYALQLFEKQKCTFHVLNTQKNTRYTTSDLLTSGNTSIYDSLIKKNKQKLERFVKTIEDKYRNENYSFKTIVDYDALTDAINQYVEVNKIGLIVMGTNGATGAKEVVFGSNTINVIRKVNCTTLVIPERFQYKTPKKLFLPLDMDDSLNSKAILHIKTFAEKFKTSLNILRIDTKNKNVELEDRKHLNHNLKHVSYTYNVTKNISIFNAVNQHLKTHEIDMLTLIVQKESAFERFLSESVTTKITQDLKVPLLIYHS